MIYILIQTSTKKEAIMKKAILIIALAGLASIFLFGGCNGSGVATELKQQYDELSTKLDTMNGDLAKLQGKVDRLEKTIDDLQKNHPELFQQQAAPQQTTEVKPATNQTSKPKTTTKPKSTGKKKTRRRK